MSSLGLMEMVDNLKILSAKKHLYTGEHGYTTQWDKENWSVICKIRIIHN